MTMLTDLAFAARKSGLRVVEEPGWKTRGRAPMAGGAPDGIAVHHTATSARAKGNYPTRSVILRGHGSLPGPLAQLGLGRDGTVYVFAAGRCNHAGKADERAMTNSYSIGIEAEHPGVGSWPKVQYDAYVALCAALTEHYKLPVSKVRGHKEFAVPRGRKNDPNFSMSQMRKDITALRNKPGKIAASVNTPPRDPRYGHRGVPAKLVEDGFWGSRTHDALMWHVNGDRLVGLTRDNVRDIQSWVGRPRTGKFDRDDIKAIQAKAGVMQDGIWPRNRKSNTTLGIQRYLNRRIAEANKVSNVGAAAVTKPTGAPASTVGSSDGGKLDVDGKLDLNTVKALQTFLTKKGYDFRGHGGIDGKLGPFTISALQNYMAKQGIKGIGKADGEFGPKSARALERFLGQPKTEVPGWYPGLIRALQRFLNNQ